MRRDFVKKKIKAGDFNLFSIIDFTSAMRIDEKMLNSLQRKGLKTNVFIFFLMTKCDYFWNNVMFSGKQEHTLNVVLKLKTGLTY